MRNDYLDYLAHSGRSKRDGARVGSGRYPLGSGKEPYQMFSASTVKRLKSEGRLPERGPVRSSANDYLESQYKKAKGIPTNLSKEEESFRKEKLLNELNKQHEIDKAEEYKKSLQDRNTILNNQKNIQKLEKELDPENIAKKEKEDALKKAAENRNANVKAVNSLSNDVQSLIRQIKSSKSFEKKYVSDVTAKGQKAFEKSLKNMSDQDLNAAIERARKENVLREAMGYSSSYNVGKEKTTSVLDTLGTVVGIVATVYSIKATAQSLKERN